MSKKMMKRSLALGALMAFVITGQAWAASVKNAEINSFTGSEITVGSEWDTNLESGRAYGIGANVADNYVLNTGKLLTITNKQTSVATRNYGIVIESGTSLSVKNAVSVDVANSGNYRAVGIRNNYGNNLIFERDVTVVATGAIGEAVISGVPLNVVGIDSWGGNTQFKGNAYVTVTGNSDHTVRDSFSVGLQVADSSEVSFAGPETIIDVTNTGYTAQGVVVSGSNNQVSFNSYYTMIKANSNHILT